MSLDCDSLNTTECILRAATSILARLEESGGEYNWDPLTFATTLVIGLVAVFFAALAITQALIAAGPGRHKCGRYALGPWARLSERRLDWSELRFRSVAYTPIMSVEWLLLPALAESAPRYSSDVPARYMDWWPHASWQKVADDKRASLAAQSKAESAMSKHLDEYFPATWLALLTSVGLDYTSLWKSKPTGADYIPADLAAAPAYVSIRDAVSIFALASHPNRTQLMYDDSSRLVSVRGLKSDLDLRSHPLLGFHGVFQVSSYSSVAGPRDRFFDATTLEVDPVAVEMLLYANGYLPQHDAMGHYKAAHEACWPVSMQTRLRANKNGLQESRRHWLTNQSNHSCSGNESRGIGPTTSWPDWCMLFRGEPEDIGALAYIFPDAGGLDLLAAKAPLSIPVLFPTETKDVRSRMEGLFCLSRLWSLSDNQWAEKCKVVEPDLPGYQLSFLTPSEVKPSLDCKEPVFQAQYLPFRMCCRYAAGRGWRPSAEALDVQNMPTGLEAMRIEIARIDDWLNAHVQLSTVKCRWLSLSMAASAFHQRLHVIWGPKSLPQRHRAQIPIPEELAHDIDPETEEMKTFEKMPLEFASTAVSDAINDLVRRLSRFLSTKVPDPTHSLFLSFFCGYDSSPTVNLQEHILPRLLEESRKFLKLWELTNIEDASGESGVRFRYPTHVVQHPLDDLLIYRATMIAVLLNAATDNSEIVGDDKYDKIIPLL